MTTGAEAALPLPRQPPVLLQFRIVSTFVLLPAEVAGRPYYLLTVFSRIGFPLPDRGGVAALGRGEVRGSGARQTSHA